MTVAQEISELQRLFGEVGNPKPPIKLIKHLLLTHDRLLAALEKIRGDMRPETFDRDEIYRIATEAIDRLKQEVG